MNQPTLNPPAPSLAQRLNLAQTLLTIVIAVGGTLLTVGMTYGNFVSRLTSAESSIQENKDDRVRELDDLKKQIVPRNEHEAHWKATDDKLDAIRDDVREVRRIVVERPRR